jgi:hypothetical protein
MAGTRFEGHELASHEGQEWFLLDVVGIIGERTLEGNISLQWNEENNAGLPTSVLIGNPFKEPLRVYATNTE